MIDLNNLSIKKAKNAFEMSEYTPSELVSEYLDVIEKKDPEIKAYLEVFKDDALSQAKEIEKKIKEGKEGKLSGIPIAVKDNILIEGKISSASSKMLSSFVAPYSATAIQRLKNEGAIFLGRTNMDEFAMGSSTENSAYGPTKNPIDESRVPGGSSGGSAAAVAMNGALAGLGTDTGGSVRQPASFCGKVGFKPTYGAISRYGLIAMGSSLDQLGTITNTVDDAERLFSVMKGKDEMDSTSYYPEKKNIKEGTLTIGVPRELFDGLSKDVLENVEVAINRFRDLGYKILDIDLPSAKNALAVYYILMPAEVSSNLARFDGVKYGLHKEGKDLLDEYLKTRGEGFGKEVRRRIMLGTYVLSAGYSDAYYRKALSVQKIIQKEYEKSFEKVDLVLTPTTPTPAFSIGEKMSDPLQMYLADVFTVPANISGNPSISIPNGTISCGEKNLPLGVQLIAANYEEDTLFRAGKDFLGE
jgi:aspartyl-tRNA(Asn)/glutamyl-tRNA(Gln) amidotransferase subunit A